MSHRTNPIVIPSQKHLPIMYALSAATDTFVYCLLKTADLASTDCESTLKPGCMPLDPIPCVGGTFSDNPLSAVIDARRVMEMESAESGLGSFKDIKRYAVEPHPPRSTPFVEVPKSRHSLNATQKHCDARTFQKLRPSNVAEFSCTEAERLPDELTDSDGSSVDSDRDSPDETETCSPVTPPSPSFLPLTPATQEEHCRTWSPTGTSHTYLAPGVAFTALGFVCPELEQVAESLADFQALYSRNNLNGA